MTRYRRYLRRLRRELAPHRNEPTLRNAAVRLAYVWSLLLVATLAPIGLLAGSQP